MSVRESLADLYKGSPDPTWNEATTRIRMVDGVLAALGWDPESTNFELPTGGGDFLDYMLRWQGEPWMVVEAKRVGRTFNIDPDAVRSTRSHLRSIQGLFSKGGNDLRAAMKQGSRYANDRAAPFCAVTNGEQWVFFRGLSTERRRWNMGKALVFFSREEVLARLDDFVDCLGRQGRHSQLPSLLDQPTTGELPEPVRPDSVLHFRRGVVDQDLITNLGVASSYLLADIHLPERLDMLDRCYVSPTDPSQFDTSIRRLLKDSAEFVDDSDSDITDGDVGQFTRTVQVRQEPRPRTAARSSVMSHRRVPRR